MRAKGKPEVTKVEHARGEAVRASWICAAVAAAFLAAHFNAAIFPAWSRGIALLSGGIAATGALLAAYSLGAGWTRLRFWPRQLAFGVNAFLALAFLFYAAPT